MTPCQKIGIALACVATAAWLGLHLAAPGGPSLAEKAAMPGSKSSAETLSPDTHRAALSSHDQLLSLNEAMVRGDEEACSLLLKALRDSDPEVRTQALGWCPLLPPEQAHEVITAACTHADADLRETAWSLLAPYAAEQKAVTLREVILQGQTEALEEALQELSGQPERALLEVMLEAAPKTDAARANRLLQTCQAWLSEGGEPVTLRHPAEAVAWWRANQHRYDLYLLQMDPAT